MRRETWAPICPDGTIDQAELARPFETAESTTWEVTAPPFGRGINRFDEAMVQTMARCPQHCFCVLFGQNIMSGPWPANATVAVGPIHDQIEADALLEILMSVQATRREAVFVPREVIEIESAFLSGEYAPRDHGGVMAEELGPRLDAIRVRGEVGPEAHPLNVHAVRVLQRQAVDFGVEFSLAWGEWMPVCCMPRPAPVSLQDIQFATVSEGLLYCRVGPERSGGMLDGKDWSER